MTRHLPRKDTAFPAPPGLTLRTVGGLELRPEVLRRHLALLGGPLDIMHACAHFMRQADEQQIPVILLGGEQDTAFLDLPDLLDLSPVRTYVIPAIRVGSSPDALREQLLSATQAQRALPGTGGAQLLFTGRHVGGYWPFVMGRLPALAQQGTLVVSDVRHQLAAPLPQVFRNFLVWPEGQERMTRAVDRWQRHQQATATPYAQTPEPSGPGFLWTAT